MAQASTQSFLEVEEIREGVLLLKNRGARGVMMVSSQNFALKSAEEQEAIVYQFQNFLNSLDFSIQILVQSRRLNLTGYFEYLKDLEARQSNELLRAQTADYREFVKGLIQGASIMAKTFFVVVPFSLIEVTSVPGERSSALKNLRVRGKLSDSDFKRLRSQLWQRMEFVALGLRRAGLKTIPLASEELIELLWSWHHPREAEVGYYPEIPPEAVR